MEEEEAVTAPICLSSMNYLEIIFPNPNSNLLRDKAAPLLNGARSSDSTNVCILHALFRFGTKQLGCLSEEEAVTAPIFASSMNALLHFFALRWLHFLIGPLDSPKNFKKCQNSWQEPSKSPTLF